MKKILILAMILVLTLTLASCKDKDSDNLQGKWGNESGTFSIEFSENNFTITGGEWGQATGTYSLTDDEIELVFDDGDIEVLPFTRTENTISIDDWGGQLTKK